MSKQQAAEFINKLDQDAALKEKVKSTINGTGVEGILDVAAVEGYQFSEEDFMAAAEEHNALLPVGVELSDEELESVAGGLRMSYWNGRDFKTIIL